MCEHLPLTSHTNKKLLCLGIYDIFLASQRPWSYSFFFCFFLKSILQLGGHMANPLQLGCGLHYSQSWCSGTCFSLLITKWALWGTVTRCPLGRRENTHMGMSVCVSRGISARESERGGMSGWVGSHWINRHIMTGGFFSPRFIRIQYAEVQQWK